MGKKALGGLLLENCRNSFTILALIIPIHAFTSLLFQQENGEDNVGDVDGGEEPPLSVAIDSKEPTNNIDKEEEHGSDDVTENANEGGVKNVEEGIENKEIVTAPEQPSKITIEFNRSFQGSF